MKECASERNLLLCGAKVRFFVGLHHPHAAKHVATPAFISVNALRRRKSDFMVGEWIMDSGAFTEVVRFGGYRFGVDEYAAQIRRWARCGTLLAAVAQDYMCESFVLEQTGKTVEEHQKMTVDRYDALMREDVAGVYIMPVLQGYKPDSYVNHLRMYGDRIPRGAWVGVGSVCKRNSNPTAIVAVLEAIRAERPDLKLHGFGVKQTALAVGYIRDALHTADSMAWSFAARREGRNANDWREAQAYAERVRTYPHQYQIFRWAA